MTTTKEKTYRLRKIMNQWHVGIYADGVLADDHAFASFDKAQAFAENCGYRDGDRG